MYKHQYLRRILEGIAWDALLLFALGALYTFIRIASDDLAFMLADFPLLGESSSLSDIAVGGQLANALLKKLILLWVIAFVLFILLWVTIKYALYMRLLQKKWTAKTLRVFALQTGIYWIGMGALFIIFRVVLLPFYDTLAYPFNFLLYFLGLLAVTLITFMSGTPFLLSNTSTIKETFKRYEKIRLIKPRIHWGVVGGMALANIAGYITTSAGLGQAPSNLFLLIYLSWVRVHYAQALEQITTKKSVKKNTKRKKK